MGGDFANFNRSPLMWFEGATLTGPPDPVLSLTFSEGRFRYNTGTGGVSSTRMGKVFSLPVPPGWEDDAQRVVAALEGV